MSTVLRALVAYDGGWGAISLVFSALSSYLGSGSGSGKTVSTVSQSSDYYQTSDEVAVDAGAAVARSKNKC